MMSRVAVVASLIAVVAAQTSSQGLSVLAPGGPDLWWIAQSINTLVWSCHTTTLTQFTVVMANPNVTLLAPGTQAIVSIQPNYDCSLTIPANEVVFPAGTGYSIQLANPGNATEVYAESAQFEIKAFGATYPAVSATPTQPASTGGAAPTSSGSSGSGTGSSASTSTTGSSSKSGAATTSVSAAFVALVGAGVAAFLA